MVEIGPGEGVLTQHLSGQVAHLIAVEIDPRAIAHLKETLATDEVEIVHADFLKTDLEALCHRFGQRLRLIGNIPYNITSPILFKVLESRSSILDATLMMQKEVAIRLTAGSGSKDYGIPTVFCQLFGDVRRVFDISPEAFSPKPRVTSSLVSLKLLDAPRYAVKDEAFFQEMVRAVFGKRRKTLKNSLVPFLANQKLNLPVSNQLQKRPEQLSVEELVTLSNAILSGRSDAPKS